MQAATGNGRAAGHIGAVLVLGAAPEFSVAEARRVLGERIRAVPRLRQRLPAPPGCGRRTADDRRSISTTASGRCAARRQGRAALLDLPRLSSAAHAPVSGRSRSATFVTGLANGGTGLLVIIDHVLADGVARLAVLGTLVDQAAETAPGAGRTRFPAPAPRARELAADAWRGRLRAGGAGRAWRAAPGAWPAPDPRGDGRAGRRPATAPAAGDIAQPAGRAAAAARCRRRRPGQPPRPGTRVRRHRRRRLLAAVAGALRTCWPARGEQLAEVTVTVPVAHDSGRRRRARRPDRDHAGHRARHGDFGTRVTRTAKSPASAVAPPAAPRPPCSCPRSCCWPAPACCAGSPATSGSSRPSSPTCAARNNPLTFGGAAVRAIIPIPSTTGNVTVTFGGSVLRRNAAHHHPVRPLPACPTPPRCSRRLRHELSAR